ncbi:MAG: DUF3179 domain-containing protein [Gemmataceae bacterium]|nr:DUF3179 domain-containing protein [Gemmataceae bacterium]MCI0742332.1 DUF3179 domain-containing protein [Gemmataceae bacterium]
MKRVYKDTVLVLGCCVAVGLGISTAYVLWIQPTCFPTQYPDILHDPSLMMSTGATPMILPGVDNPNATPADQAMLSDDAEVAGIVVNGRACAFLIAELSRINSHVVNDVLAGTPVTVTFCNKNNCLKAFTSKEHSDPLPLGLGGWHGNGLILRYADKMYAQENGRQVGSHEHSTLPFAGFPVERMTWKEWRAKHTASDVVIGLEGAAPRKSDEP